MLQLENSVSFLFLPGAFRFHALFHRPSTAITRSSETEERASERAESVCGRAQACINTRGEPRITSYGR